MIPDVLMYAGVAAATYLVGKYAVKGDNRVEQRRLDALAVGGVLREMGLKTLPGILDRYAVGDYSGLATYVKSLADTMTKTDAAKAEFEGVFDKMLLAKLNNPETRKQLQDRINSVMGGPL